MMTLLWVQLSITNFSLNPQKLPIEETSEELLFLKSQRPFLESFLVFSLVHLLTWGRRAYECSQPPWLHQNVLTAVFGEVTGWPSSSTLSGKNRRVHCSLCVWVFLSLGWTSFHVNVLTWWVWSGPGCHVWFFEVSQRLWQHEEWWKNKEQRGKTSSQSTFRMHCAHSHYSKQPLVIGSLKTH